MKSTFVLFFLGVLGISFLGDLAVSKTTLFIFENSWRSVFLILGALPYILTAAFIASLFIGSYRNNILTRKLSLISSLWMGYFFYALIASILNGIIAFAGRNMIAEGTLRSTAAL